MFTLKDKYLAGLSTFVAVAKYTSFTQAASHLHMTTGAISQQMKSLEERLDIPLFNRHSRGITLTDAGMKLLQVVEQNYANIATTIEQLQQQQERRGEVHLKLTPSFAFKWLVPRLQNFYNQYPDIKIHTFAESGLVDHQNNNYDLAIDYGKIPYKAEPQLQVLAIKLLLKEQLIPVMSPDYFAKFDWQTSDPQQQKAIWQQVTLLHDSMPWQHAEKDEEWQFWFTKNNIDPLEIANIEHHDHYFNRTDMAMAAAAAGLGVALGRMALIENGLEDENLVAPFPCIAADAGYYLLQHRESTAINCFKTWLLEQTGQN